MNVTYFLLFLSLSVFGQGKPRIEVLPDPKSLEDFDHQFKGCLENSECDQVMGLQLSKWNDLIKKLKQDKKEDSEKNAQILEAYREKYGIPIEFYTSEKSLQGLKPLLFNSPCKDHNPKTGNKTLKGMAFIKSIKKDKAIAWIDQTQMEIPVGEIVIPQPVHVYFDEGEKIYQLPLNDQPLLIKDNNLYVLKEEDNYFYVLKVSPDGVWKIDHLDFSQLSLWEDKRSEVECPKTDKPKPPLFNVSFCKSVWDVNRKKTIIVKMHLGCVI